MPFEKIPNSGERAFFKIGDKTLALFNVAAQFYAIDDSCPHQGASLFSGRLEGRVIQCCAHGLRFDLTNGCLVNSAQLKVATYPVEVIEDKVFIVIGCGGNHE
ncbi:Rieske 2Fe-2S domain-containing protein [Acinetobacter sp. V102_4]|uniref:Rieske (2Fe-2S) protein n=1 Tax=Acinetobacter sp. V102_4 TaxID=3072984 RepID=UPI00287ED351|nr:Rieske 2Fe-2S domain-containing protein [Acinetobacter sp. V102_4]MDS7928859.1 Rieske 2Fe-2S domain-containing protein [Acinetobacter sp. V102_4]